MRETASTTAAPVVPRARRARAWSWPRLAGRRPRPSGRRPTDPGSAANRSREPLQERQKLLDLEPIRGPVHHQPRADLQAIFHGDESVLLEGMAGLDEIDAGIREPRHRGKLDRARQANQIHRHSAPGERAGGERRIFGRDPQAASRLGAAFPGCPAARDGRSARRSEAQPAFPESEIERREHVGSGFEQVIEAADAEIGGSALDVQRHVWILEEDEAGVGAPRRDDEAPRPRDVFLGVQAGLREPLERRTQGTALGESDGDHAGLARGTRASRSSENPTAGRGSPNFPSRPSYRPPPPTARGAPDAYRLKTRPV